MDMSDFRRMAARMDQHMQLLEAKGVTEEAAVINAMMGYMPELHQIWTGTTDEQLMALSNEFPGFCRYAFTMETAFERERQKVLRPYDNLPEFADRHKKVMEKLLTTAAGIERGYLAFQDGPVTMPEVRRQQLYNAIQTWVRDVARFRNQLLNDSSVTDLQREYVNSGLDNIDGRLHGLAAAYRNEG